MLISDITKRILIYDNYDQAKATEQSYLIDGKVQGVQLEQIDLNRWKIEVIYAVGDYQSKPNPMKAVRTISIANGREI